jgi:CubicO group peptidase (beta-lactamase class C family)
MRNKLFMLFSLFMATFISVKAQNHFFPDSLESYIQKGMEDWKIPGMAIAIIKDGKVAFIKGYGVREYGKPEKVDENTIFAIASNSKAFTGTALSLLQYQKKLSLDDKVTKWMPWFKLYDPYATKEVNIRDLLCHRIGFGTFQSDFSYWDSDNTRREIMEKMRYVKPDFTFRNGYGYCNSAFLTAGEIIPLACDTTWDDFVKYRFFTPLKMTRSFTTLAETKKHGNLAQPHQIYDENDSIAVLPWGNPDNLGPAASINSCVKDMSNWLLMQLDSGRFEKKRIIPYSVLKETRTPHNIEGDVNRKRFPMRHFVMYGLGWEVMDYAGREVFRHTGGADGFGSLVAYVPEEDFGIVVLTNNVQNSFFHCLVYQLLDYYRYAPFKNWHEDFYSGYAQGIQSGLQQQKKEEDALRKKGEATSVAWGGYTGKFHNEVYGDCEVRFENAKLSIHFENHPTLVGSLSHLNKDTFKCVFSNPVMGKCNLSFKIKGKKAKGLTLNVDPFVDSMTYEFTRK